MKHFGKWTLGVGFGALALGCGAAEESRDPRVVTRVTSELRPLVEGSNAFTLDFYAQAAANREGNLFASPLSIAAVFALAELGAGGKTQEEMRTVLHIGTDETLYHPEFGRLMKDLGGDHPGRGYELSIANRLFLQNGFTPKPGYSSEVADDYGPGLENVDFSQAATVDHVNDWVKGETQGLIAKLFDHFDSSTRMALANAIYFHGLWASPFEKENTTDQQFAVSATETKQVPMMHTLGGYGCGGDTTLRVVELDYVDHEVSMLILMPGDFRDPYAPSPYVPLADFESSLSIDRLTGLLETVEPCASQLALPKFVVDSEFDLAQSLPQLGMTRAFSEGSADFSRLTDEHVFIDRALHKAHVEVDENGTRAAAATGATLVETSASLPLSIDHPFVFLIRDKLTSTILFMGRITDPTASDE